MSERKFYLHKIRRAAKLAEFDFNYQPWINKEQIQELNSLSFIDQYENVIFYGNSRVGKTHLTTSIGVTATQNRNSTKFHLFNMDCYVFFCRLMETYQYLL